MTRSSTNSNDLASGAVVDLAAHRRAKHRVQAGAPARRPQYTFGFTTAEESNREPVIVRLNRQLEKQGLNPAERLALVVALPDDLWDAAWAQLREHIERERAA